MFKCRHDELEREIDPAHQLHDDVDLGIFNQILPAFGEHAWRGHQRTRSLVVEIGDS